MLIVPSVRVTRANSMQLLRDGVEWLGGCDRLTILTSANATNNYRTECYYATAGQHETEGIEADIRTIIREAYAIV